MQKNNPSRLALGAALLIMGLILLYKGQSVPLENTNTFAQEPVQVEGFTQESIQSLPASKRIIIPALKIDLEVERAKIVNGYWEVFADKAGWGEGTGFPGQPGNQVIFAHAKEGLFLPLRSIEVGMEIYILTDSLWYKYAVTEVREVNPDQVEVITPTPDETLTLYTCSSYKDSKRLIVSAKPN